MPFEMEKNRAEVRERDGFLLPQATTDRNAVVAGRFGLECFWASGK